MNELLRKRTADMLVSELMEAAYLIEISKKLTLDMSEFCKVVGKDKKDVYALLKNRIYPSELIVGGYEGRTQKKKYLFHTDKVIEWIKR